MGWDKDNLSSTKDSSSSLRKSMGFMQFAFNILIMSQRGVCFSNNEVIKKDVFLNITGGISVDDPAIDLAVIAAILSSNEDIPIEKGVCFAAEVGLAGEIRPIQRVDQRILEAEKLGFTSIYVSKNNKISLKNTKIAVHRAARIEDVVGDLFG